jgi:tetratricopeptide (TPR) repeat protein
VPEAIAFGQASLQRDPLSDFVELLYGHALYFARRYEEGAVHLQRALELNPQNLLARQFLSDVYSQSGKLPEARTLLDRPEFRNSATFAAVNARLGRRDEALRILEALGKDAPDSYGNALAYFALGDQERGFEWLARAIDRRQLFVSQALFDPAMPDSVRSQPRFQELMAKLKLPAR